MGDCQTLPMILKYTLKSTLERNGHDSLYRFSKVDKACIRSLPVLEKDEEKPELELFLRGKGIALLTLVTIHLLTKEFHMLRSREIKTFHMNPINSCGIEINYSYKLSMEQVTETS